MMAEIQRKKGHLGSERDIRKYKRSLIIAQHLEDTSPNLILKIMCSLLPVNLLRGLYLIINLLGFYWC